MSLPASHAFEARSVDELATAASALKNAIELRLQVEERELAVELLPTSDEPTATAMFARWVDTAWYPSSAVADLSVAARRQLRTFRGPRRPTRASAAAGAGRFTRGSHTVGMTNSVKIAVSLPAEVAERARRAVRKGHATSVSAYVATALEEKAKLDELATLLSEMLAESGGPLNAVERRAADRALGVTKKQGRKVGARR